MKQPECTEGPKALENFERFAIAALKAPKPEIETKKKKQVKPASQKSKKRSDKG